MPDVPSFAIRFPTLVMGLPVRFGMKENEVKKKGAKFDPKGSYVHSQSFLTSSFPKSVRCISYLFTLNVNVVDCSRTAISRVPRFFVVPEAHINDSGIERTILFNSA